MEKIQVWGSHTQSNIFIYMLDIYMQYFSRMYLAFIKLMLIDTSEILVF